MSDFQWPWQYRFPPFFTYVAVYIYSQNWLGVFKFIIEEMSCIIAQSSYSQAVYSLVTSSCQVSVI